MATKKTPPKVSGKPPIKPPRGVEKAELDQLLLNFRMSMKGRRQQLKLRQRDLADKINRPQNIVADLKTGARKPALYMLVMLARALDTTVDRLLDGTFWPEEHVRINA